MEDAEKKEKNKGESGGPLSSDDGVVAQFFVFVFCLFLFCFVLQVAFIQEHIITS